MVTAVVVSNRTSARTADVAASGQPSTIRIAGDLAVLDPGPPPSIEQAGGWLNSGVLTDSQLRGKVVLYDFWTFACINCQHTVPHVQAWQERYASDGLSIISIHTPEFDFEAVPDNVAKYVTDNRITYPVALDPNRSIWHTWNNHYWPAFYLYDSNGRLRVRHFGEGSYDPMEDAIRVLLGVDPLSGRTA